MGAAAAASMRRTRAGGGEGGASSTMLQFYTEETPGLRLSPNVVLIMKHWVHSLCWYITCSGEVVPGA
ncbi:hypothetical protein RHGRI_013111 [Rhododendron griersonianum]|uniref:Uncharacterized protein n=1 Tax=Rhododendron griersonianum TaxID=479676 RepID=A0AAV6K4E7_9ERIC|nr:hypothetical protein RHGRI_013111 [Rhododendron griersonianum]